MTPRDVTALCVPFPSAQNVRENAHAREDVARGARLIGSKDGTLIVFHRGTSTVLFLTALDLPKFVIGRQTHDGGTPGFQYARGHRSTCDRRGCSEPQCHADCGDASAV